METDGKQRSKVLIYLQCYFLTIAYILGTGVLGLPVTLARSGLTPFFVLMTICLVFQIIVIYLVTDLLQKLVAIQLQGPPETSGIEDKENDDTTPLTKSTHDNGNPFSNDEGTIEKNGVNHNTTELGTSEVPPVNLFLLGKSFLPKILSYAFTIHVMLTLMINGLSYALAGSQAYADILSITSVVKVLPFFCWILNVLILFGRRLVDPFISVLTLLKGALLLLVVIIAFIVGSVIHNTISNDFSYTQESFLMVTVGLGGISLTMPYMFTKIGYTRNEVRCYRFSVVLGMVTCYILEVLWCWSVLDVVPQTDPCYLNNSTKQCLPPGHTLLSAKEEGQISTIPFETILHEQYPQYNWVATVVSVFIMISITVSYTFNGTVLCETLEGAVGSVWKEAWDRFDRKYLSAQWIVAVVCNIVILIVIFVIALLNPKGFIDVVQRAMSIAVNFCVGFYICIMTWICTGKKYRYLEIPLPLSTIQVHLQYIVCIFFMFASIYDIVLWVLESAGAVSSSP